MINICMLTYGREKLTSQAISSLDLELLCPKTGLLYPNPLFKLHTLNDEGKLGTGMARNKLINSVKERGEYLYISDNDIYFLSQCLETLIEAFEFGNRFYNIKAMGAYNHPYNVSYKDVPFYSAVLRRTIEIGLVHALATQSWLMKWEDWDKYGPFKETSPGLVCQGDDVDLGCLITRDGGKLAVLKPPMLINCGLTNTCGEKIPGYDLVKKEYCPKGVIRE